MKAILLYILVVITFTSPALAQSVTIYRAGIALSPSYTTIATALTNVVHGDSLVLSAHTFYEHDLVVKKKIKFVGIPNGTIIDAQNLGRVLSLSTGGGLVVTNVILQNGYSSDIGGGIQAMYGPIELQGKTVIQNCYAKGQLLGKPQKTGGGGIFGSSIIMRDNAKIINNSADGSGAGAVGEIYMYDSSIIANNTTTEHGGGVNGTVHGMSNNASIVHNTASKWGGGIYGQDSGCVTIAYNTAGIAGGGVYSLFYINGAKIYGNQAPLGAALVADSFLTGYYVNNSYVFNPSPSGARQNEIHAVYNCMFSSKQCWWGKGDVSKIFSYGVGSSSTITSWVVPNWRINRTSIITKSDTFFPIQAALKYNTGVALVHASMPWLLGNFSSSKGTVSPTVAAPNINDTIQTMFKTYIAPPINQSVDFTAYIDLDTFRVSSLVWGIDTSKPKDTTTGGAIVEQNLPQVLVYPNPAHDQIHVLGLSAGSNVFLFDLCGRLMLYVSTKSDAVDLNIASLATGSYFIKVIDPSGLVGVLKLQKE